MLGNANRKRSIAERWIDKWLTTNQAQYHYQERGISVANLGEVKLDILIKLIWADAQGQNAANIRKEVIADYLSLWQEEEHRKIIAQYQALFANTPLTSDQSLREWVKALTGGVSELDLVIMKHFIWQVQRKLLGLKVTYHVMPIIVGKTGSGKSEAVLHLLSYIKDLTNTSLSFDAMADEKRATIFNENFVLFFDEMAYARRVDVDILKNRITAPSVSYRPLYTNTVTTIRNNATFLGCANKTVKELIYDPTGVRRFWEIITHDKCDWKTNNNINLASIWHCVDPQVETPLLAVYDQVRAYQENELRNKDAVEIFIESRFVKNAEEGEKVKARDLYSDFKFWCEESGEKPCTETAFGIKAKAHLKSGRDINNRYYLIKYQNYEPELTTLTPEQKRLRDLARGVEDDNYEDN